MERMTKGEGMTPEEYIAKLEEENKKLKEQLERMKTDAMYDMKDINSLYEENKKLKEELKYYKDKTDFLNKVIVKYQEED